jgi:hypothetical protein
MPLTVTILGFKTVNALPCLLLTRSSNNLFGALWALSGARTGTIR